MASAAKARGTKIRETLALVDLTASFTVLKTVRQKCSYQPF